jgi:hypothetical protein
MRFNLDNYETVEQRLAKFWEEFPNGQVFTSVHYYDENRVVFKAEVYRDIADPRPVATGHAEEVRDASPVNRTSHVENSETSAIGRALANWKFQSKTSPRPSREEMEKVARAEQPKQPEKLTADFVTKFREACAKKNVDPEQVAQAAGVDLNELRDDDAPKLRDAFKTLSAPKPLFASPEKEQAFVEQIQEVFPTAEKVAETPQIKDPGAPASAAQVGKIRAMLSGKGVQAFGDKLDKVREFANKPDLKKMEHLTKGEANNVINMIEAMK